VRARERESSRPIRLLPLIAPKTKIARASLAGTPKGVEITHFAAAAEVCAMRRFVVDRTEREFVVSATRRFLSFLTLSHIFDRWAGFQGSGFGLWGLG
jgi:hypothetical protein